MYKALAASVLLASLVACNQPTESAPASDSSPLLASAFGGQVTLQQIERELRHMNAEQRSRLLSDPAEFKKLVGVMLFQQRAVKVAEETGVLDDEYRFILERDRQRSIARRLASDQYEAAQVPDLEEEALAYYHENPQLFTPTPRLSISHIQLNAPTPEDKARRKPEAEKLLKQIREGADFGRLATDHSEDFGRYSAGDIGFIKKGDMVDEFWDAAYALEEGQISDLVETRVGWHIIRLDKRGPSSRTPFEQAKDAIIARLEEEHKKKAVEDWVLRVAPPDDVEIQQDTLDQWWNRRYEALRDSPKAE